MNSSVILVIKKRTKALRGAKVVNSGPAEANSVSGILIINIYKYFFGQC